MVTTWRVELNIVRGLGDYIAGRQEAQSILLCIGLIGAILPPALLALFARLPQWIGDRFGLWVFLAWVLSGAVLQIVYFSHFGKASRRSKPMRDHYRSATSDIKTTTASFTGLLIGFLAVIAVAVGGLLALVLAFPPWLALIAIVFVIVLSIVAVTTMTLLYLTSIKSFSQSNLMRWFDLSIKPLIAMIPKTIVSIITRTRTQGSDGEDGTGAESN